MQLSQRTISKLAEVICGAHGNEFHPSAFRWENFPYRTGGQLTEFFTDYCNLSYEHSGTRITWTTDVLKEINTGPSTYECLPSNDFLQVLKELLEAVRIDLAGNFPMAVDDLNEILVHEGLQIRFLNEKYFLYQSDNLDNWIELGANNIQRTDAPAEEPVVLHQQTQSDEYQAAASTSAIGVWQEKLAYFQMQEAIVSDVAQKFELSKRIQEVEEKIRNLVGK